MKMFVFATILLIAYWFNLPPGVILFLAIAFIALFWWSRRGAARGSNGSRHDQHTDNAWTASDMGSIAVAAIASEHHDASAQDNRCDTSSDNFGSSDSASCSDDSGSSDSGGSSSSSD